MPKVMYASTKNPDMYYTVQKKITDPFFLFDQGEKKYIFLDAREFGKFQGDDSSIEVVLLNPWLERVGKVPGQGENRNKLAWLLFQEYGLDKEEVTVPTDFPLDMADFLRSKGVQLTPIVNLYPERAIKSRFEIEYIKQSLGKTRLAFDLIREMLERSLIKDNTLIYQKEILTSERIKRNVNLLLFENGMIDLEGMIISSGPDTAVPHAEGTGPIRPHQPIICDIFPCSIDNLYFADMTRTYIKGNPKEKWVKMYDAVLQAQNKALDFIYPDITGQEVHEVAVQTVKQAGFDVGEIGYVHATGHGLGLEVHEEPRINSAGIEKLVSGNVITIEPGLYYPEYGGVRIEDVVAITEDGCVNLTEYPKDFYIP